MLIDMTSEMEMSENLIDLLHMVWTIIVILGIFFIFIEFNVSIVGDEKTIAAISLGDAVTLAPCLTEQEGGNPVKALFLEEKIAAESANTQLSCIARSQQYAIFVSTEEKQWTMGGGGSRSADFPVAVKMKDGRVLPGKLTVNV